METKGNEMVKGQRTVSDLLERFVASRTVLTGVPISARLTVLRWMSSYHLCWSLYLIYVGY